MPVALDDQELSSHPHQTIAEAYGALRSTGAQLVGLDGHSRELPQSFYNSEFYVPLWSNGIWAELRKFLLSRGKSEKQIDHPIDAMSRAFEDACIRAYEDLISSLTLPDPDEPARLSGSDPRTSAFDSNGEHKTFPCGNVRCVRDYDSAIGWVHGGSI
jgi:hypothetical protein